MKINSNTTKNTRMTARDIKKLKYNARPGYLIPLFIFIFGTIVISGFFYGVENENITQDPVHMYYEILFLFLACSIFSLILLRKFFTDLNYGIKELQIKIVKGKEHKIDYEAGSGTIGFNQEMRPVHVYNLLIDNYKYPVEKDLFDKITEGDEVVMNYAPKTRELLDIEIKK
jgi:hypothetical protein